MGLDFEGVGWLVGGLVGGVGNGLVQGAKGAVAGGAGGAVVGLAAGAVVGAPTGPGEVVTIPSGAVVGAAGGAVIGGSIGAVEGVKAGVPVGQDYGASAGRWLDDKISQMTGADEEADAAPASGASGDCTGNCAKGKERKNKDGDVILDEDRAEHILSGDKTGGGHRSGTGRPGKTEFPSSWSDDDILDGVADVAQNGTVKGAAHRPGEVVKTGTMNGVDIDVVVKEDGGIRTGYPTGGTGVISNPR